MSRARVCYWQDTEKKLSSGARSAEKKEEERKKIPVENFKVNQQFVCAAVEIFREIIVCCFVCRIKSWCGNKKMLIS